MRQAHGGHSTLHSLDCRSVCSDILHKNMNNWNFCTKQVSATVMLHPVTNSYYHMHALTPTHKSHLSASNSGISIAPTLIADCPPFVVVVNLQPTSKLSALWIHQPQCTIAQGCMHKWGSVRWVTTQTQLHAWTVSKWSGLNWGRLKMTVTT